MIIQSIKMALKSLRSNKLRSFLTMLGIIIGVFALVVLVSLVSGATNKITDSISSMGSDMISVSLFDSEGAYKRFTINEVLDLPNRIDSVGSAAVASQTVSVARTRTKRIGASLYGITPSYFGIQGLKLKYGRLIMSPDYDNNTNVVVLDGDAALELFGRENCVGETIKLDSHNYLVVGVLESTGSKDVFSMIFNGMGHKMYIPYSSLIRMSSSVKAGVDSFVVSSRTDDSAATEKDLTKYLKERYDDNTDVFFVFRQSTISDAMNQVTGTLSLLLGGIAAISLLVGGIGIMNIMLVSVTERTKEIGIRKAIGAQPKIIMLQFLVEAITLSIVGCLAGIILSWITIEVINIIADVSFGLSIPVIIVSVLFSSGVGILFGLYPAYKASRMKPIDALRFS